METVVKSIGDALTVVPTSTTVPKAKAIDSTRKAPRSQGWVKGIGRPVSPASRLKKLGGPA
jgi:hypothetical protein